MLLYAKDLIPDICRQHLNNLEYAQILNQYVSKFFEQMLSFYDKIIFTQSQISTTLAEMSDLSLLWKLRKTLIEKFGSV